MRPRGLPKRRLDSIDLALHEIRTSLGCSEQQAQRLLTIYNGNSSKAINEIKTGRAVLPREEASEFAIFGGEFKTYSCDGLGTVVIATQDGALESLKSGVDALLVIGVLDPDQRPDARGNARADRGQTYAQLFWRREDQWVRFLLNSSRMDYSQLKQRRENSAIRNFRILIGDLLKEAPGVASDASLESLRAELRAPHYRSLADFEAAASQILRDWKF